MPPSALSPSVKSQLPSRPRRTGKGGRPSKAREGEISDEILDAASEMFASQGYAAMSVERLAAACRVGKDTVYRRYPSKRALFDATIERLRTRVLKRLESVASEQGAGIERLRRTARWLLAVNVEAELVALRRIAFSEAVLLDGAASAPAVDPIVERLIEIIRDAQGDGAVVDCDPGFLALQLSHAVASGPSIDAMLGGSSYATSEAQDAFFEKAWSLFMNGAKAR